MEAPLLPKASALQCDYVPVKSFKEVNLVVWSETVKLWKIAAPVALATLFQYTTSFSSITIFSGHLGDLELSAISLHYGVLSTFVNAFLYGMSTALGTLCGQAFGAGQVQSLGIYLQRSWIVLLIICIILLPVQIFASQVFKFLGQENDIANLAGEYAIQVIPQVFASAISYPTMRFLQAQSKVNLITWVAFVALILQNVMLYIFIYVWRLGTTGAAIASNISGWFNALSQVIYVVGWCKDGWNGFTWFAFKDLWTFSRLSFASSIVICLDPWYMALITLLAGKLDNAVIAIGSLSVCSNFQASQVMLFVGVCTALSVRISNELGKGHPRAATYCYYVTMFESVIIGTSLMIAIILSRDHIAIIFTDSEHIRQSVARLAPLLGVSMLLNSALQVIIGVAIGSGWQVKVAYINSACCYLFGLPLGLILGFKANLGVMGLWGGTICSNSLQILILLLVIFRTNWNDEVEKTSKGLRQH